MGTSESKCMHLRERDYFDGDYDLRYDATDTHDCAYFRKPIIPAQACTSRCPGFRLEATSTVRPRERDSNNLRNPVISSDVTHVQVRNRLTRLIRSIDQYVARMNANERLISANERLRATLDVRGSKLDDEIKVAESRVQRAKAARNQIWMKHEKAILERLWKQHSERQFLQNEIARLTKRAAEEKAATDALMSIRDLAHQIDIALKTLSDPLTAAAYDRIDRILREAERYLANGVRPIEVQQIANWVSRVSVSLEPRTKT